MWRWVSLLGLWLIPSAVNWATVYQTPIDQSIWSVEASIFECKMTHEIPYYGQGVFLRRAGESAGFSLAPKTPRLKTGKALLVSQSPMWRPGKPDNKLGYIAVTQGDSPINLGARLAEQMLSELKEGRDVVMIRRPWYGPESAKSLDVGLSTVNFRSAYRRYLDCLGTLLPVNFDQISRLSIYFTSGSEELKPSELKKLDNLILYVNADPTVDTFYIDGHTDSVGGRPDNLELSKMRAEYVADFLQRRGVSPEKITTRWHGERYPVASNGDRSGRAQNRRVTIRLERTLVDKLPELAAKEGVSGS